MRYWTVTEIREITKKQIREWEHEFKYERSIVCSIPAREIGHEQISIPVTDWCSPG